MIDLFILLHYNDNTCFVFSISVRNFNLLGNFLRKNFYILFALYAIAIFMANDMFLPAVESISDDFGVPIQQGQYAITWFIVGMISLQLYIGPLSDKYGRKIVIIAFGLISFLGILFSSMVPNIQLFFLCRFLSAVAAGAFGGACIASIMEFYPEKKVILIFAILSNITIFAPMLGPVFGSIILVLFNWRMIFFIDSFILIFSIISIAVFMPETLAKEMRVTEVGFMSIIVPIVKVAKNFNFIIYSIGAGFAQVVFLTWIFSIPIMFIVTLKLSSIDYAMSQIPALLAFGVGNFFASYLINKLSIIKTLYYSYVLTFISVIAILIVCIFFPRSVVAIVIAGAMVLFSMGVSNSPRQQHIISISGNLKGTGASFLNLIRGIFALVTSIISAFIGGNIRASLSLMIVCALMSVIISVIAKMMILKKSSS